MTAYYITESKFTIQNIQDLRNPSGLLLKASLIRHRINAYQNNKTTESSLNITARLNEFSHTATFNTKCIVFLHGLGSSRLQSLPIVQCLPKQYCLFAFDFAGSGKSQGENITYGLRQSEDICCILDYLRINKGIKQFIIWGRSMGAVAALLYSINLAQNSKQNNTLRSQLSRIKGMVIDSPFSDFKQITKHIGLKRINMPQFLIQLALSVIEQSFNELLNDKSRNKIYNPFSIKLSDMPMIDTKIPTVFVYCQTDQVVPKQHSQKIIKNYRALFDKFVIQDCSHNQPRPRETIDKVFQSLKKFQTRVLRQSIRNSFEQQVSTSHARSGMLTRVNSVDMNERGSRNGRRGISVESKQKQKSITIIANTLTQQQQNTKKGKKLIQSINYNSLKIQPKRDKISCKMNKYAYISECNQQNDRSKLTTESPLKIRLSNSFNRQQNRFPANKKNELTRLSSNANFYSTIQYDSTILQKKLLKYSINSGLQQKNNHETLINYKILQNKVNAKYRRHSQLNRKVQYQLNHTRYL